MLTASASWADPIADKKAEAARIQEQLDKQGRKVSILAEQSNRARIKVDEVTASLAKTQDQVSKSDARLQAARSQMASAAVLAYVHGGSNSMLGKLARSGGDDMVVRSQYLRVTAADQRQIIDEVRAAREDFQSEQATLQADRKAAAQAADAADAASKAAAAAEDAQKLALSRVTGELSDLVAADEARKEAEDAARRPAQLTPVAAAATVEPLPRITATPDVVSTPTTQAPAKAAPAQAAGTSNAPPPPPASDKGAIAVAQARKALGKPYVYGGAGPDSFDCSGLTSWAWRAAGVNLSHSAGDQYFETTRVPLNAVAPGDLLFFGDNGVDSIYHVTMYIGDGNMIEASTTGTPVRIRGWRSADLVGAGRPG